MKKHIMLTAVFVTMTVAAIAQTASNCVPVDGGLSLLVAAGIAGYSAKKVAEKKKQSKDNTQIKEK
ncbi:MAG: hypothetical protein JNK00_10920 [Flavipsychrobacter sp.]|nr:hypothetical protein [Flavipsychrobacter sp.]